MAGTWTVRRPGLTWAVAAAVVLAGCADAPAADEGASPEADADAAPDRVPETTAPSDTSAVAAARSCGELHAAVLGHLDAVAARADTALPDDDVIDAVAGLAAGGELPDALGFLERLQPMRPYGGIAGELAEERYEALSCTPDDEYPAIAAHLDVPAEADDAALQARFADEDGGSGAVTLGLVRRLLEGSADSDDAAELVDALEQAAAAQEAVRATTGGYTDRMSELVDAGMPAEYDSVEGVFVMVLAADDDGYCMTAAAGRGVAYVESHDAAPVVGSRPDPATWCAATFAELE